MPVTRDFKVCWTVSSIENRKNLTAEVQELEYCCRLALSEIRSMGLKALALSFRSFMGCLFCIRGGISSVLSLPNKNCIVFHQSLLENFPDVFFPKV